MKASIGVNLRVTGHCQQGGRKYMEDFFTVAYQQTPDEKDLEYAFFGIFDGHGGPEAAEFAKDHLMEYIVKDQRFWMDEDEFVLQSIQDGFIDTHHAMWRMHDKWPRTASGLPSTAGTTASVAFIRRGKIYIGHVGDSGITLGYQEPGCPDWKAKPLTVDHKPESQEELSRIEHSGGKVILKSGVPRVVWNRPRIGHKGPVRRSTPIDEIPFLAVARSLGDLWSYNPTLDEFVVSPKPDVRVIPIDTETFRCLIFATDGLYNMLNPHTAVRFVQETERRNESAALHEQEQLNWINPSKTLVERALERWSSTKMRADNTSVITLMLDPPGPPRAQVLRSRKSGLKIESRYAQQQQTVSSDAAATNASTVAAAGNERAQAVVQQKTKEEEEGVGKLRQSTAFDPRIEETDKKTATQDEVETSSCGQEAAKDEEACKSEDDKREEEDVDSVENIVNESMEDGKDIQINEISSSSDDSSSINYAKEIESTTAKAAASSTRKRRAAAADDTTLSNIENKRSLRSCSRNSSRLLRERKLQQVVFIKKLKINGEKKKKLLRNVFIGRHLKRSDDKTDKAADVAAVVTILEPKLSSKSKGKKGTEEATSRRTRNTIAIVGDKSSRSSSTNKQPMGTRSSMRKQADACNVESSKESKQKENRKEKQKRGRPRESKDLQQPQKMSVPEVFKAKLRLRSSPKVNGSKATYQQQQQKKGTAVADGNNVKTSLTVGSSKKRKRHK